MSAYVKNLEAIQQEIKELVKNKNKLKKKEHNEEITAEEEIELEGINELLTELKGQQKFWQGQVDKENAPEQISKSFKEADADWIASVTGIDTEYREWTSYHTKLDKSVVPTSGFKEKFEDISEGFHMYNEAGRRIFLNLFLLDIVLLPEFNRLLRIFPEIEMSVETQGQKKRKLNGKTDYTVGFAKNSSGKKLDIFDNTPPRELHLVAFEAKTEFGEKDLWQCVAETATLYKSRKDANKEKCSVWGVLSNATTWKFIYIDEDGKLWRSNDFLLNIRSYKEDQILPIYQFLYYIVKCCFEACTPTPTPNSSIVKLNE
ncbi:hypothetical protein HK103_006279 [Boothiomyces macroporosus]|uniref:Uncharacterized protein n=1 Tax=Boothiomyces macroporosus TaxID=261099 RepID=A0AAD5Y270_9FUNG|nr:hypothetical protein HK103_006279 [Boothiomyces macroporosus]